MKGESLDKYDIVILTDDNNLEPAELTTYYRNILKEDELITNALKSKGLTVSRKSWSDPVFDWQNTSYAIFRSTWDYFHRFDEFIRWMGRISRKTDFINTFKLAQWNLDKHYLLDLQRKGIPIVPTHFIKPLAKTTLQIEVERKGWVNGAVLKPSISASSRHTYRVKPHNIQNHESVFQRLLKSESLMIQPFLNRIVDDGEISLMVINGEFTHAVIKKAKHGDFRVQEEFGGTIESYTPSTREIELAEQAVSSCPHFPLYARVDMVLGNNNELMVSELELIEPDLFFRTHPKSADHLAETVIKHMK